MEYIYVYFVYFSVKEEGKKMTECHFGITNHAPGRS